MAGLNIKDNSKTIILVVAGILLILSFFVIKQFITTLITSAVLAYLFHPLYTIINKKFKNSCLSSLLIIILIIVLIALPSYFIIKGLIMESKQAIKLASSLQLSPEFSNAVTEILKRGSGFIATQASEFLLSIPRTLLNLFILIFSFYYFLKDGPSMLQHLQDLLPLKDAEKNFLKQESKKVTSGVIYGLLISGLIQGVIGAVGFYLFGVSSPILWGAGIMLLSIIPGLGNFLIWIPIAVVKFLTNHELAALGILGVGIIISIIELFVKTKWMSGKSNIHPIIILLGVIGGLSLFGFIGIIIGPLVLSLLTPFIKLFVLKKNS